MFSKVRAYLIFSIAIFVMTTTHVVSAQSTPVALDYHAPAACPDEARLIDEISARLGYVAISPSSARTARVRVFEDGVEFTAMLELDGASRMFRGSECADVIATVASALATELDRLTAAAQPAVAVPPVPAASPREPGTIRVRIESEIPQLSLHRVAEATTFGIMTSHGGATGYSIRLEEVCEAPCEASLSAGRHALFVARPTGGGGYVREMLRLDEDSLLRIDLESHETERIVGWVSFITGAAAGLGLLGGGITMLFTDLAPDGEADPTTPVALMASGGVTLIAGMVTFFILAFKSDVGLVDVQPLRF